MFPERGFNRKWRATTNALFLPVLLGTAICGAPAPNDELFQEHKRLVSELRAREVAAKFPLRPKRADSPRQAALMNLSAETLWKRFSTNLWRIQQVYGPEDEFNPMRPDQKCKPGANAPDAALVARLSASIGVIVPASVFRQEPDGSFVCDPELHGEKEGLCPDVCFADHCRIPGIAGTGFLERSNTVLTARHVIEATGSKPLLIIFGHSSAGTRSEVRHYPGSNVFELRISGPLSLKGNTGDWARVELARPCQRKTLPLRKGIVSPGALVFIIGHPYGLPVITAGNASVRSSDAVFFRAFLDASEGDSGAPVFDSTGTVVGIFRGGGDDYVVDPVRECKVPLVVDSHGLGQVATHVGLVTP